MANRGPEQGEFLGADDCTAPPQNWHGCTGAQRTLHVAHIDTATVGKIKEKKRSVDSRIGMVSHWGRGLPRRCERARRPLRVMRQQAPRAQQGIPHRAFAAELAGAARGLIAARCHPKVAFVATSL